MARATHKFRPTRCLLEVTVRYTLNNLLYLVLNHTSGVHKSHDQLSSSFGESMTSTVLFYFALNSTTRGADFVGLLAVFNQDMFRPPIVVVF